MSVTIGILAGMGPRTTAPFVEMLATSCQELYGATYDMDFPLMHIISLPTPFYPDRETDSKKMIESLVSGIKMLVKSEVSIIVVPCNSAHCYFESMEKAAKGIPILHIADAAVINLPETTKTVALLATEATLDSGFYQERLHHLNKNIIETPFLRKTTTKLILAIKERGYKDSSVKLLWKEVTNWAIENEIEGLLIGCTDISPLLDDRTYPFIIVDTSKSLANAAIQTYMELKNIAKD